MASANVCLQPVPLEFENINTVEHRLKTLNLSTLPDRYVHPRSPKGSIHSKSTYSLPVIDLKGLKGGSPVVREEIVRQLGRAAEEFGFFQVVNHGVPQETLQALDRQAREFFDLDVDIKERAQETLSVQYGYNGRLTHFPTGAEWVEFLAHSYRPTPRIETVANKVWPGGNPAFCELLHDFCQSAEKLGLLLLELLTESLGLEPDCFSKHFQDLKGFQSAWRLHRYPACPDPLHAIGAVAHSDTSLLTLLTEDEVGGLQALKDGSYIDVTPIPGAFVVNVGDTLEAWTNGRFQSAEHRVLVNGKADRHSMVYLIYGGNDLAIESPPELIDEAHPSLYLPFTAGDYRTNFVNLVKSNKLRNKAGSLAFALK